MPNSSIRSKPKRVWLLLNVNTLNAFLRQFKGAQSACHIRTLVVLYPNQLFSPDHPPATSCYHRAHPEHPLFVGTSSSPTRRAQELWRGCTQAFREPPFPIFPDLTFHAQPQPTPSTESNPVSRTREGQGSYCRCRGAPETRTKARVR